MSNKLQVDSDPIVGLERTRLRLEQEVPKLQKSLLHWQTWEAEYEGFKEEIQALGDNHTNAELVSEHQPSTLRSLFAKLIGDQNKAGATFEGTLLNEKGIIPL